MHRPSTVQTLSLSLTLLVLVSAVGATALPAVGASASPHGAQADFEVVPVDRQPGLADATYKQFSISPLDIEYLDFIEARWKEGGFAGCGPSNSEAFGIDRGNDDPGTSTDEGLTQYVKSSTVNEDVFRAEFYDQGDAFGTSTNLNEGDEFVSFTKNCFDNPAEPGWYQISASLAGTKPDGTYVEETTTSHYFAVCDCASREEAVETLQNRLNYLSTQAPHNPSPHGDDPTEPVPVSVQTVHVTDETDLGIVAADLVEDQSQLDDYAASQPVRTDGGGAGLRDGVTQRDPTDE